MPNYCFRVTHENPDSDVSAVIELPDEKAAWDEATTTCGEMLADLSGSVHHGSVWSMEVSNDDRPLFELTFGARRLRKSTASSALNKMSKLRQPDGPKIADLSLSVPRPAA